MHIIESETLLTVYTYPRCLVRVFSGWKKPFRRQTDGRHTVAAAVFKNSQTFPGARTELFTKKRYTHA